MNENAMAAYLHLLRSVDKLSAVDDKIKIKSAYTLFKVVCRTELTSKEKWTVEKEWKSDAYKDRI